MRVITGTVVNGKIEIPGAILEDGASVAILAPDSEIPVELSTEEQNELLLAMEEIHRGELLDGNDLLREIRAQVRTG